MADRKLTDLTEKVSGSLLQTDTYYMVDTTDTSSDPAGSSYKTTYEAILNGVIQYKGGIANGLATLDSSGQLPISQVTGGSIVNTFNSRSGAVVPQLNDYTALLVGYTSPSNTTSHTTVNSALDQVVKYVATSGIVKINSYAPSEDKPNVTLSTTANNTFSGWSNLNYGSNLNFSSVTQWPIMDSVQSDSSIWDNTNQKFRENNSVNQPHIWRIVLSYSRTTFTKVQLLARLYNPDTGFEVNHKTYFSEERQGSPDTGTEAFELISIADSDSLSTDRGYFLQIGIYGDNGTTIDIELDSITRISLANANQNIIS